MYNVPAVQRDDPGWRFVGLWVLTYVLGSGFGMLLEGPPLYFLLIPLAQTFVLHRHIPSSGLWFLVTFLGGLGVLALSIFTILVLTPDYMVAAAIAGLSLGVPQFLLLRRSVPQASWWIALQVLAPLVGAFVADQIAQPFYSANAVMLIYALLSGLGLRWLLAATPAAHQNLRRLLIALAVISALMIVARFLL